MTNNIILILKIALCIGGIIFNIANCYPFYNSLPITLIIINPLSFPVDEYFLSNKKILNKKLTTVLIFFSLFFRSLNIFKLP